MQAASHLLCPSFVSDQEQDLPRCGISELEKGPEAHVRAELRALLC